MTDPTERSETHEFVPSAAELLATENRSLRAKLAECEAANRAEREAWSNIMVALTANSTYATSDIFPAFKRAIEGAVAKAWEAAAKVCEAQHEKLRPLADGTLT
ncbi:MAG TPA: hypothetical protein VFT98_00445, partial [Myxococcota bacterium]|nr:hypothetical protein [Myxococcota bacterium]